MKKFEIVTIVVVAFLFSGLLNKVTAAELAKPGTSYLVGDMPVASYNEDSGWIQLNGVVATKDLNSKVGIGTSNPKGRLHVHSTGPEGKLIVSGGNNSSDTTRDQNTYSNIYLGNANPNDPMENSWIISHNNHSYDPRHPLLDAFTISRSVGSNGGYSGFTPFMIRPRITPWGYISMIAPINVSASDDDYRSDLHTATFTGANGYGVALGHLNSISENGHLQSFRYKTDASGNKLYDVDLLLNAKGGNVGVGTTNPRTKLTVESRKVVSGIPENAAIALNVGTEGITSRWAVSNNAIDKSLDFLGAADKLKVSIRNTETDKTMLYVDGSIKLQPLARTERSSCVVTSTNKSALGRIYFDAQAGKPAYCSATGWVTFDGQNIN